MGGGYPFLCSYNSFKNKRPYNEDRILINSSLISEKKKNFYYTNKDKNLNSLSSYNLFCIFDGHSGKKCSTFLMENFSNYLFDTQNRNLLSTNTAKVLKETYLNLEQKFFEINNRKNILVPFESSGSCALSILTKLNQIFVANCGDSRAIYCEDSGKEIYQISYEHKPLYEKKRIEKAGGKIFSNKAKTIWRIKPGNLAVIN